MSSVFSIEPDGITRAWPMVPLIRRNTSPTQNHAMISRWIFVPTGTIASCFFFLSAFTFHHHRPLCGPGFTSIFMQMSGRLSIRGGFADLELHQVRGIDACITRRTKAAFGISNGLSQGG